MVDDPKMPDAVKDVASTKSWAGHLEFGSRTRRALGFWVLAAVLTTALGVSTWLVAPRVPNPSIAGTGSLRSAYLDSDHDGLPDAVELEGWTSTDGEVYSSDPKNDDTDGDGLTDGSEAGRKQSEHPMRIVYVTVSDPADPDTDDDLLGDRAEIQGWTTEDGSEFRTDPRNSDSDGDGLWDSDEAGEPIRESHSNDQFVGFSDPNRADSDDDGLGDAQEADQSTDPYNEDSDDDGISDQIEVESLGTDPLNSDTDSDSYPDGAEVNPETHPGFDPLFEDVQSSTWEYATEFARGAIAGDASRSDSLAWLAGNLAIGGASFLPGAGWIIGGVADARDAVASAVQSDWVGVGFSAVGLIPGAGDTVAIPRKISAFVTRNAHLAPAVGGLIASLNSLPNSLRVKAAKEVWNHWESLERAGADSKALLKLQTSSRMNLDVLANSMQRKGHIGGSVSKFLDDGPAGERELARELEASGSEVKLQVREPTGGCIEICNPRARVFDVLAEGVAHESKVGPKSLTAGVRAQVNSDAYLIKTGRIDAAHWHFYPSSVNHQIGASEPLLDYLDENGIRYTIHLPVSK